MISTFFEHRPADQHGHAAAVLPEVLLLEWLDSPDQLQLCHGPRVAVAPFRRRQARPVQATRGEILSVVSHDAEKRVIRLKNATFEIPDDDPDDIGVDQTPDFLFALFKIALELDVLLGRFSPPSRFEPRERQRRPC